LAIAEPHTIIQDFCLPHLLIWCCQLICTAVDVDFLRHSVDLDSCCFVGRIRVTSIAILSRHALRDGHFAVAQEDNRTLHWLQDRLDTCVDRHGCGATAKGLLPLFLRTDTNSHVIATRITIIVHNAMRRRFMILGVVVLVTASDDTIINISNATTLIITFTIVWPKLAATRRATVKWTRNHYFVIVGEIVKRSSSLS